MIPHGRPIINTSPNKFHSCGVHLATALQPRFISHVCNKTSTKTKKTPQALDTQRIAGWSYWPDSNRRPADYESAALPTEPQQQKSDSSYIISETSLFCKGFFQFCRLWGKYFCVWPQSHLLMLLFCAIISAHPPVAKLDIAADSDSEGRGFESLRAGHKKALAIASAFLVQFAFGSDIRFRPVIFASRVRRANRTAVLPGGVISLLPRVQRTGLRLLYGAALK